MTKTATQRIPRDPRSRSRPAGGTHKLEARGPAPAGAIASVRSTSAKAVSSIATAVSASSRVTTRAGQRRIVLSPHPKRTSPCEKQCCRIASRSTCADSLIGQHEIRPSRMITAEAIRTFGRCVQRKECGCLQIRHSGRFVTVLKGDVTAPCDVKGSVLLRRLAPLPQRRYLAAGLRGAGHDLQTRCCRLAVTWVLGSSPCGSA
jgi:hypothetical protein